MNELQYTFDIDLLKACVKNDWKSKCITFIIDCKIDNACAKYTRQIITNKKPACYNIRIHQNTQELFYMLNEKNVGR